ncbi:hypothetical protein DSM104443_02221 [Usitatibacter rugosus]|uniref:HNH nuclease domain-containing protein n=1 Tax=Usitatibacter rugosus TaxID=2732067 RepID=A0A6M4GV35_9PROT|nr:hypothetical protein DSM104443_02221 [Usitatibacter rugosus]
MPAQIIAWVLETIFTSHEAWNQQLGRRRRWTDDALRIAVANNRSVAGTLRALGIRATGGNYGSVMRHVAALKLDVSHWTGQAHRRGCKGNMTPTIPLTALLRRGSQCQSNKLRRRLLAEGYFKPICRSCGLRSWLGRPIHLELDHIDGDHSNNALTNLRLLCPNCHAQTPTYKARNISYDYIPTLDEIKRGIARCGSIRIYAKERRVSDGTVRGWLRSDRLKREAGISPHPELLL